MRISDWSSDVCSSDLSHAGLPACISPGRFCPRLASGPQNLSPGECNRYQTCAGCCVLPWCAEGSDGFHCRCASPMSERCTCERNLSKKEGTIHNLRTFQTGE